MKRIKQVMSRLAVIVMLGGASYVATPNLSAEGIGVPCFNRIQCWNGTYAQTWNYCSRGPYCCIGFSNDGAHNGGNCYSVWYCVYCPNEG